MEARSDPLPRAVAAAVGALVGALALAVVLLRPRRFVVADRSMEPTLVAGQGLLAVRSRRARPGELRCLELPGRAGFWLVKRVATVAPDGATMHVASDHPTAGAVDSRRFGAVPVAGARRVVVVVPRRLM